MNPSFETLDARVSVRSYTGAPLSAADRAGLEAAIAALGPGPFGGRPRFALIEAARAEAGAARAAAGEARGAAAGSGARIGTYGVIRGAAAYLGGALRPGPRAFEDFGYAMEGLALEAAARGLGSCWLGGTFDRGGAAQALGLAEGELLPALVSLGTAAERRSATERLVRFLARPESRKAPSELFFEGGFGRPYPWPAGGVALVGAPGAGAAPGSAGEDPWLRVLEAVRRGPSASNKQPWRILSQESGGARRFLLYLAEDKAYNRALGPIRIQDLDMGIAMRHFEVAARLQGLPGAWSPAAEPAGLREEAALRGWSYVATWA